MARNFGHWNISGNSYALLRSSKNLFLGFRVKNKDISTIYVIK